MTAAEWECRKGDGGSMKKTLRLRERLVWASARLGTHDIGRNKFKRLAREARG